MILHMPRIFADAVDRLGVRLPYLKRFYIRIYGKEHLLNRLPAAKIMLILLPIE